MTAKAKALIKAFFVTGAKPTQAQFIDFIDSYVDSSGPIGTLEAAASAGATGFCFVSGFHGEVINAANALSFLGATVVTTAQTSAVSQSVVNGANFATLNTAQTFSGAQKVSATILTSSSSHISTDLSLNNIFTHTMTENTTLDNPTNIVAGWEGSFQITNHASSPKTLAYGSYFKFPGGSVPTLTATNGAADTLFCVARSSTFIEANLVKGFA